MGQPWVPQGRRDRLELERLAEQLDTMGGEMGKQAARCTHIAAGPVGWAGPILQTTNVTVTWPNGGFPNDQYEAEAIAVGSGVTGAAVVSQTATTVTVAVTVGLSLGVGAPFVVFGSC